MKVKIQKIKELPNALHPNNIEEGFERVGEFREAPECGKPFYVGWCWSTSTVQYIIDENEFATYNSIYKWTLIPD